MSKDELPLDDPKWWPWGRAIEHVRQVRLNHAIADQELATAINERNVRCKMEALDPTTSPPKRVVTLLEDSFFADRRVQPGWGKLLVANRSGARLPSEHVMYAWRPDIEKIWSLNASTTTISSTVADGPAAAMPRQKPGRKAKDDWPIVMASEVIRLALRDPEMLKNVAGLGRHMKEFLEKEIGWAPKDRGAIEEMLRTLLQRVR